MIGLKILRKRKRMMRRFCIISYLRPRCIIVAGISPGKTSVVCREKASRGAHVQVEPTAQQILCLVVSPQLCRTAADFIIYLPRSTRTPRRRTSRRPSSNCSSWGVCLQKIFACRRMTRARCTCLGLLFSCLRGS